jgi:hypothetical protein
VQTEVPAHFVTISARQELTDFFFALGTLGTPGKFATFLADK